MSDLIRLSLTTVNAPDLIARMFSA